ncbi:hypothetical protein C8R43DRAFT_966178 [Mycena crocata]|nr:hypothetical protein C8R43DRAFT_966178 [Mycena crocata]
MTDLNNSAPAAAPAVAGAAAPPPPSPAVPHGLVLLSALTAAVDKLTVAARTILETSSAVMEAVNDVELAAEAVDAASAAVVTAYSGTPASVPVPPASAPVHLLPAFLRTAGPWMAGLLYGVVPSMPLGAIPDNNDKWFAITRGKYVGLTRNSAISLAAVTSVSTGMAEKHASQAEALAYFNDALLGGAVALPSRSLFPAASLGVENELYQINSFACRVLAPSEKMPRVSIFLRQLKDPVDAQTRSDLQFHIPFLQGFASENTCPNVATARESRLFAIINAYANCSRLFAIVRDIMLRAG